MPSLPVGILGKDVFLNKVSFAVISGFATRRSTPGGACPQAGRTARVTQGRSASHLRLRQLQTVARRPLSRLWGRGLRGIVQSQSGAGGDLVREAPWPGCPPGSQRAPAAHMRPPPGPGPLSAARSLGSEGGLAGGSRGAPATQPQKPRIIMAGGMIDPASQQGRCRLQRRVSVPFECVSRSLSLLFYFILN